MPWRRLSGEYLQNPITEEVEIVILEQLAKNNRLKVCIGTDSQVKNEMINFATVIVFLIEGKGGFMFVKKEQSTKKMGLKERMIQEVAKSIDIVYEISHLLDQYKIELEVHADINTDPIFKSSLALKEAMGYIKGMGFTFKAKPYAFASSSCADKVV